MPPTGERGLVTAPLVRLLSSDWGGEIEVPEPSDHHLAAELATAAGELLLDVRQGDHADASARKGPR